jgi:putative oxidoreductase
MDVIDIVGRVLFAAVFWRNGYVHLRHRAGTVEFSKSFGTPYPSFSVPFTGVLMLVCGTLFVLGIWADLAALLLAAFLLTAGLLAHRFWQETDYGMRAAQEAQFMKNLALAGACLVFLAWFSEFGDDVPSVGGPLF